MKTHPILRPKQAHTRRTLVAAVVSLSLLPTVRADYASEVASENPLVYYRFNDSVTTSDSPTALNLGSLGTVGNGDYVGAFTRGVAGAISGDTAAAFTQPNATAIDFTGGINIPYNIALNPSHTGTNPFTVECWVKPNTNTSTLLSPVNSMSFTTGRAGFLIYQNGAKWQLRMGNKASTTATVLDDNVTGGSVTAGQWQHLAATYTGGTTGTMTLYVNGVSVGSMPVANYESNDNAYFVIGGTSSPNRTFDGAVDEVAFYGSLLSPARISARVSDRTSNPAGYQTQVLADSPVGYWRLGEAPFVPRPSPVAANSGSLGSAAAGSYYAGAKNSSTGPSGASGFPGFGASGNSALSLTNANGYVGSTVGLLNNRTAFTVAGWVKRGAIHSPRGGYFGQNDLLEFGDASTGTTIETYIAAANGSLTTPYTAADDVWQFIALTASGTRNSLYIDGVEVTGSNVSITNYGSSAFGFNIGGGGVFAPTGDYFRGEIDEVAIFDKALTSGRIKQLFDVASGNVPPVVVGQVPSISPSGTIVEGQSFTLSVDTSGTPPFTYRWLLNGQPISGATGATYTVPAAALNTPDPGAAYSYSVEVTNSVNTVTSDPIDVLVVPVLKWVSPAGPDSGKWDFTSLNWKAYTAGTVKAYADEYSVLFDDTAISTDVVLKADVYPTTVAFNNSAKNYTVTGPFAIRGPFPTITTKSGTGTVLITTDTYEVDVLQVDAGKFEVGNGTSGSLGLSTLPKISGGELAINLPTGSDYPNATSTTGGVLSFKGTGALSINAALTGAGNVLFDRNGTVTMGVPLPVTGAVTINSGILSIDGSQVANRLPNGKVITVNSGGTLAINGVNALPTAANSILPTLHQGTLRVVSGGSTAIGAAGTSHVHLKTLTLDGSSVVLDYSGQGGAYNGESFQLNGDIIVTGTAASTISFGTGATPGNAGMSLSTDVAHTFSVPDVAAGPDLTITAEVENNDSSTPTAGVISKTGAGTLVLGGNIAHSFTGTTRVNEGTLQANGSIAGPVEILGTSVITPGPSAVTFSTGGLVLQGNYACDINGAVSDRLQANGDVTIAAGAKIILTVAGAPTAPFYEILKSTGTLSGTPTVTGIPSGYSLSVTGTSVLIAKSDINIQPMIATTAPSGSDNFNTTGGGFTVSAAVSPQTDWTYSAGGWTSLGTDSDVGGKTHTTYLTTPVYTVTAAGPVAMSFSHSYNFEEEFDAGAVEISVNGGAFTRLPGSAFTLNGYDGILGATLEPPTNSALSMQEGFLKQSVGYPAYHTTTATLVASATVGSTVQVRFMGAYDDAYSPPGGGWKIDSFEITNALPNLLVLSWEVGVMQYSDDLLPPWTDIPGTSPLLIDTKVAPKRFFRLKP